jgi:MFS family permease
LISLVLTLYNGMVLIASTFFGRLGDTLGRKKMVVLGFMISAAVFYAHNFIGDLRSLFIIRMCAGFGVAMVPGPLAALVGSASVGVFTAAGSFGFMIASILAGFLQQKGLVFTTSALMCVIGMALALAIREKVKRMTVPFFPWQVIKKNADIYLPYFIRHSAASAIWAIFPIYLSSLGADTVLIGVLYAINPLMQVTFMLVLRHVKSDRLITTGLIASAVTFFGYTLVGHWGFLIGLQALLGFSWANLYLGSMKHLLKENTEQATATGILNSIFGLSGIVGPLIGGLVSFMGLRVLLGFSTVVATGGFIVSRNLRRRAAGIQRRQ